MAKKKPSAFDKKMQLTPELEAVIGKGPMKRTDVTKQLWAYIKKKDLQNPANKREILLDDKLKAVMGKSRKKVDMFEMTRLVSAHLS